MSDTEKKHGTHGVVGGLKQVILHPAMKQLAEITITNPTIAAWIHANPIMAERIGQGVSFATGMFDIPYLGPIINEALEMFAAESMELLDKLAADSGNPDLQKAVAGAVAKSVEKAAERGAFLVLELVHDTTDCLTVASYATDTTPKPFVDRKSGKSSPQPSTARIVPTKLGAALMAGKKLCPICFPDGQPGLKAVKDHDKASAAPSSKTVGDLYFEWLKTDETKAKAFFKSYVALDNTMSHKFTLLFAKKGSLELLQSIASHPVAEWSNLIDAMLGPSNRGAEGIVKMITNRLENLTKDEGAELGNVLGQIEAQAGSIGNTLKDKLAKAKDQRAQHGEKSNGSWWIYVGGACLTASVIGMILYLINTN